MPSLLPGLGGNPSAGQTRRRHSTPSSSQKSRLWGTCLKPRKKKFTRVSGTCGLWKKCSELLSRNRLLLRGTLGQAHQSMPESQTFQGFHFPSGTGTDPVPLKVTEKPEQALPSSASIRSPGKAQEGYYCHRLFSFI